MRGTPHVHSLVWIANDGITEESVNSENTAEQQKVKNLIKKTVSSMFVDKVQMAGCESDAAESIREEEVYNWNPCKDYFNDKNHPCRLPFNSSWGYTRNAAGEFSEINVQNQYRALQIGNQFHDCCSTCFKYYYSQEKVCRTGFPKASDETTI
jgi:hypothetical protein